MNILLLHMNILVHLHKDDSLQFLKNILQIVNLDINIDEVKCDAEFLELYERNIYDILFILSFSIF